METVFQSAGDFSPCSSMTETGNKNGTATVPTGALAPRDGTITIAKPIDTYLAQYAGRDGTRAQRLGWWRAKVGTFTLAELSDDHVYFALEELAAERARYFAGRDADGKEIFKAKRKPYAPATLNRYGAAIAAVCTWAIKRRIAPKGWENPCGRVARHAENNERVRFLSDDERERLLAECKRSKWTKLHLFVMMGITTGARRGEIEGLRWRDVDLDRAEAMLAQTKNGDRRTLPLVPVVVAELRKFQGGPDALVFASRRCPDVPYNHVTSWHSAMKAAGIRGFRYHDLRHTTASYLAQSGATLLQIADVLGHRNTNVTKRYSHLTVKHKAALVNAVMGEIFGAGK